MTSIEQNLIQNLLDELDNINIDKDGSAFICEEALSDLFIAKRNLKELIK